MISKSKKFRKRSLYSNLFFSIFLGSLVLVVIGFLVVSTFKLSQRRWELNSRIDELKKEVQILEEKNQNLQTGISQTKNEDFLEKVAKEELNLKNPGEKVVVIKKEQEQGFEETQETKSFLDKILEIFKMRD
ncbi:septum formation initiator family protein [Patescibacteria group bacterium]